MNVHNIKLDFGRHTDKLLTRIPVSYLKWMVNELPEYKKIIDFDSLKKLAKKDFPNHKLTDNLFQDWLRTHSDIQEQYIFSWKDLAKAELERRGDTLPTVEISGHAIDKASLRVLHIYREHLHESPNPKGFYSWLSEITLNALEKGEFKNDKYHYEGMKLVIEKGNEYPILKTIMI